MIAQILNLSSNISTVANTNKHYTLQVRWELLIQICNNKFDNMVTTCLPLSYTITG